MQGITTPVEGQGYPVLFQTVSLTSVVLTAVCSESQLPGVN